MPETKLSRRLHAAFLLVKGGGILADIGTDHALLPIALVKSGKARRAFACDINPKPLEKAAENIKRERLEDKISTLLADGAEGLEGIADEFVIAGMGGELIAEIIGKAPFLKKKEIHLVLQPMTKKEVLRAFLWDNGYAIGEEKHIEDAGHCYTLLSVRYVGEKISYTDIETYIGKSDVINSLDCDGVRVLVKENEKIMQDTVNRIKGRESSAMSVESEKLFLSELKRITDTLKGNINET